MSQAFEDALRELDGIRVGSWKWLSRWRRLDRDARQLWLQVMEVRGEGNDQENQK